MIRLHRGLTKDIYLPIAASVAAVEGTLMAFSSGTLIIATATTAPSTIIGVLRKTIKTTDSDYASAKFVPVQVPVEHYVEWEMDVVTGTLVVGDVGLYCDITTASASTIPSTCGVNRDGSTYDVVQISRFVSTTKDIVFLNTGIYGCGVIGA